MLQAKEHTPTFYPSIVFTFGLVVESIKEFGNVLDLILTYLKFPKKNGYTYEHCVEQTYWYCEMVFAPKMWVILKHQKKP
jgi:hypothetical protein